jgi:hypothetical protein
MLAKYGRYSEKIFYNLRLKMAIFFFVFMISEYSPKNKKRLIKSENERAEHV